MVSKKAPPHSVRKAPAPAAGPHRSTSDQAALEDSLNKLKSLEITNAKSTDPSLKQTIDSIHSKAPRFLFRVWSSYSGGNAALNTAEAITPHSFLLGSPPAKMYQLGREEIYETTTAHFLAEKRPLSHFSSWSQSLRFVLCWASDKFLLGEPNVTISVLDTKRLPPQNKVLATEALHLIHPKIHGYPWEYLIFGPVSGTVHASASWQSIQAHSNGTLLKLSKSYAEIRPPSSEGCVALAKDVGALFGKRLELAVMVYLLCACGFIPPEADFAKLNFAKLKITYEAVPEEWGQDFPLSLDCYLNCLEARAAVGALGRLVTMASEKRAELRRTPAAVAPAPALASSRAPSAAPSRAPSAAPSRAPSAAPSRAPSAAPSRAPSAAPSRAPSAAPSRAPSAAPSRAPSAAPSRAPSVAPSPTPSVATSQASSRRPSSARGSVEMAILESPRVSQEVKRVYHDMLPRELRRLYIDLHGWRPAEMRAQGKHIPIELDRAAPKQHRKR